ncbi:dTMP kinase [Marinobacter sp.]|uniref:dTMP kinase n=1 Tax=Marinobacter sp. TaxID=50741 RepID=UPI0023554B40|nr:dTMP kinase [Marinobacter sp.]
MKSKVISIEGVDGSGKNTQANLLLEVLQAENIPAVKYSFPCYEETFFGKEIGSYLRGEFGDLNAVHPKLASMLFAGDRFEKKGEILSDLKMGKTIIMDRYVDSNLAHQCAKLGVEEHETFISWAEELEYQIYGLPRPDKTIFLDIPIEVSTKLVLLKKQRSYTQEQEDIHEKDHEYMRKVYSVYEYLSKRNSWELIECLDKGQIRSPGEILNDIVSRILGPNK